MSDAAIDALLLDTDLEALVGDIGFATFAEIAFRDFGFSVCLLMLGASDDSI